MTNPLAWPRASVAAAMLLAVGLAGCQGSRLGALNTASRAPAPIAAAPTGAVTSSQLPPPTSAGAANAAAFPEAPEAPGAAMSDEEMQLAAASAPEITAGSVAGVWSATIAGQSCRIATPQTKFGQGFRAGPLACPPPISGLKSWNVEGKQLSLYDEAGNVVARLYSSGAEKFDGQTTTGLPISLSR